MTTFAHTETGRTVDVILCQDLATYKRILNAPDSWQIVQVPDGTLNGSTPDGQGGWTAPPLAAGPAPQPMLMTGTEFHTYCATVLGTVNSNGPTAGMARMGDIVLAMRSLGGLVAIAYERYQAAGNPGGKFNSADMPTLMGALQAAGIITTPEATALVTGWPRQ